MVHMTMITEICTLSLSLCRWINLHVGQVAQAPNRPTAHVVRAMKDEYLGTHQYYGPQRASSIDTRCNHNLKMPFVPVLCVRWAVAAAPGAAQPGWIHNFCNGQVSQLLDPTERLRCYDVIDGVFVTQTLHVCWYHTCICPLDG